VSYRGVPLYGGSPLRGGWMHKVRPSPGPFARSRSGRVCSGVRKRAGVATADALVSGRRSLRPFVPQPRLAGTDDGLGAVGDLQLGEEHVPW
jgi:hypothetical protein